jgi:predicted nucleic acid-binding protein
MSAPDFLDTNVLVYAYETADPRKQRIAQQIMKGAVAGDMVLSSQVAAELASTLLHKLSPRMSPVAVGKILDALASIRLVQVDLGMVRRAVEAHAAYGLHFYDGMIVAAAARAGCERIWSEDLNPGQKYFGVTVANPFL